MSHVNYYEAIKRTDTEIQCIDTLAVAHEHRLNRLFISIIIGNPLWKLFWTIDH